MDDLKLTIAENITALRQSQKMTQIELAEKLNYSDKAVSKWERGESLPDVLVLKAIADLFGVTLDYLLEKEHSAPEENAASEMPEAPDAPGKVRMHAIVTALSVLICWFVATACFVVMDLLWPDLQGKWLPFVYAVPVSMIVWLVFNSIWFNPRRNYLIISLLMWSTLAALTVTIVFAWQLLLLGIPGQLAIIMRSRFGARQGR